MLTIPELSGPVLTGEEFYSTIDGVIGARREGAIYAEFLRGNVPQFMRQLVEVKTSGGGHDLSFYVTPDYLCCGTDANPGRLPMYPGTAQEIADLFDAVLPTAHMSDLIWAAAGKKLPPTSLPASAEMASSAYYKQHNKEIESLLVGVDRHIIVAGQKKDIVVTPELKWVTGRVAIYGWHRLNGVPIQGLNAKDHASWYVDYSHGVRLVGKIVTLNGKPTNIKTILTSPTLCKLLTGSEGPVDFRYPV